MSSHSHVVDYTDVISPPLRVPAQRITPRDACLVTECVFQSRLHVHSQTVACIVAQHRPVRPSDDPCQPHSDRAFYQYGHPDSCVVEVSGHRQVCAKSCTVSTGQTCHRILVYGVHLIRACQRLTMVRQLLDSTANPSERAAQC